ncbi:MAG: helix-turn-helix domain-containing protein [Proteobacteria bacterium]|nr:helix-turn-helix domain-containing protein [Pseudomonadota bacterium]
MVTRACPVLASETPLPTLAQLTAAVALSPHQLHRLFRTCTGVTPHAYARQLRAKRLRVAQQQFRDEESIDGDTAFETMVAQVVGFIEAPQIGLQLPLNPALVTRRRRQAIDIGELQEIKLFSLCRYCE